LPWKKRSFSRGTPLFDLNRMFSTHKSGPFMQEIIFLWRISIDKRLFEKIYKSRELKGVYLRWRMNIR
jgi:hypothetical protein